MASTEERFWSKVNFLAENGCWEWVASKRRFGYGQFWDGQRHVMAHRYSYESLVGSIPEDSQVLHHCDNPSCINPFHLFLGTQGDNMRDMRDKGRRYQPNVTGENNGRAKLTLEQVEKIRLVYEGGGVTQKQLASLFGISKSMVSYIVRKENWRG